MDSDQTFPLFKAPLDQGNTCWQTCVVCRRDNRPCIGLGDLDHLIVPCRRCEEHMGLRVGCHDTECLRCGEFNLWPADFPLENAAVCFNCLNAGLAAVSHQTELGIVSWPNADRGLMELGDEALARRQGLEIWIDEWGPPDPYIRVPSPSLHELLRTPRHYAWQSEYWPLHCGRFCAFLGHWKQSDFDRHAEGRGQEWFEEHLGPSPGTSWDLLRDDSAQSYVYQCLGCQKFLIYVATD